MEPLEEIRVQKLKDIESLGFNPYPTSYRYTHTADRLVAEYSPKSAEELAQGLTPIRVAGRILAIRKFGKAGFLTGEMLSQGTTVIDAGINVTPSGITGDVNVDSVKAVAGALSPVPGGVGAVTTSLLLRNVVSAAEEQNERRARPRQ